MSKRRLVVPEARTALDQFKMEIAKEVGVDNPDYLASYHTGHITKKLVEMGEKNLIENYKFFK